ncbi:hypothetical protein Q1695_005119 [Nippostrongylus brasiliensis]|nr:hypothetical protein Q1695_005119 [Nippostrongylus brasiliensis]
MPSVSTGQVSSDEYEPTRVTSTTVTVSDQDDKLQRRVRIPFDFSVSRLVTPYDEYSLYSLIRSWSLSQVMSCLSIEDKKVINIQ